MIRLSLRDPDTAAARQHTRRHRFGLDAPLPADPAIVERAVLRHIAACRPGVLVLPLCRSPAAPSEQEAGPVALAAGLPDLLLFLPDGRPVFLVIKTQARVLTRAERAFADLCRTCAVPVYVVRSLPEAEQLFDRLGIQSRAES